MQCLQTLTDNGFPSDIRVLVIAMANSFVSYLTTFEEYQVTTDAELFIYIVFFGFIILKLMQNPHVHYHQLKDKNVRQSHSETDVNF